MPISMLIAISTLIAISRLIAVDHMYLFMYIVLVPKFADIALASMKHLDFWWYIWLDLMNLFHRSNHDTNDSYCWTSSFTVQLMIGLPHSSIVVHALTWSSCLTYHVLAIWSYQSLQLVCLTFVYSTSSCCSSFIVFVSFFHCTTNDWPPIYLSVYMLRHKVHIHLMVYWQH